MTDGRKDKFDNIENNYRALQTQEQETLGSLRSTIRGALEIANPKNYAQTWGQNLPFYDSFLSLKTKIDLFMKIKEQMEFANMQGELREYPNKPLMIANAFFLGFLGWGFYRMKSWSIKFTFLVSCVLTKTMIFDSYFGELHTRKVALDYTSPVSQELRNLYRFYAPNDLDVPIMDKKCQEYLDILELRRALKKNNKQ